MECDEHAAQVAEGVCGGCMARAFEKKKKTHHQNLHPALCETDICRLADVAQAHCSQLAICRPSNTSLCEVVATFDIIPLLRMSRHNHFITSRRLKHEQCSKTTVLTTIKTHNTVRPTLVCPHSFAK